MSALVDRAEEPSPGVPTEDAPAALPATGPGRREPRETSGMTSRLMLQYAEREGGPQAVDAVLAAAGLADRRDEMLDENAWFSFDTKVRLFEALAEVLGDQKATRHAGEAALELNVANGLKLALRALGSPALVYRNIIRANAKFSARHSMEILELSRDRARIRFSDIGDGEVHPLDCEYNIGLLSCVPAIFGQAPARVRHTTCAARGAEACVYDLTWESSAVTLRSMLGFGATGGGALAGAAIFAPALLPAAGVVAGGAAAIAGLRAARQHLARWRQLESEVEDQAVVSERMSATMQDLTSELRLDELLDKIVHRAQSAVSGKQFALLVADENDGALSCASSSGLPAAAIATLEAWAAEGSGLPAEPIVIEDVDDAPGLAALAEDEASPMRSLCAVPLVYRGQSIGLLVALAPAARTFLPRDVERVCAYAVHAAIALTNARLFAAQHALATRDALTGLFNHREFHESIDRELERSRRHGGHTSVALFDLDGFKLVNDASGHAEGDRVLREAAAALGASGRASDLAFRIGGDEFALLLPDTPPEEALAVAERAAEAVAGADARTSSSFGVAGWPRDGWSKDVILAEADARLYAMKSAHRPQRAAAVAARTRSGELASSKQRNHLAMISRLAAKLAPVLCAERIAAVTVAELEHTFDTMLAYVQRLDGDTLRVVASGGTIADRLVQPRWTQGVDQGVCGRVARTAKSALVHNTALDADHVSLDLLRAGTGIVLRSQLAVPVTVGDRLWGVLSIEDTSVSAFGSDDVLLVETVAAQVGAALHRSELVDEVEGAFTTTLGLLCDALEAKDDYTAHHADAVGALARRVGERLGLAPDEIRHLEYAALMHDIGKIGIRTEILTKPAKLTDAERAEMERHTIIGADMLRRIPFFAPVHPLVRSSHERWDGAGYPDRLAGDAIPVGARVIAACDAFHAMTSDRPYRHALPREVAIAELRRCAGGQFDPRVVEALLAELR